MSEESQALYARRGGNLARDLASALPEAGFALFIANEDGTITTATNLSPDDLSRVMREWIARIDRQAEEAEAKKLGN